jgi:hypothetical protein
VLRLESWILCECVTRLTHDSGVVSCYFGVNAHRCSRVGLPLLPLLSLSYFTLQTHHRLVDGCSPLRGFSNLPHRLWI